VIRRDRPDFDGLWAQLIARLRPEMQALFRLKAEIIDEATPYNEALTFTPTAQSAGSARAKRRRL